MKKFILIFLLVLVLVPLLAVTEDVSYRFDDTYYDKYIEAVMSKYFDNDSGNAKEYISEYSYEITMKFKPSPKGYSQILKGLSVTSPKVGVDISPYNFEIILEKPINETIVKARLINEDVATGEFSSPLNVEFKVHDNILTPATINDFQKILDYLSVGRGYSRILINQNEFYLYSQMDIYYFDVLYCSLWMEEGLIDNLHWYSLLR